MPARDPNCRTRLLSRKRLAFDFSLGRILTKISGKILGPVDIRANDNIVAAEVRQIDSDRLRAIPNVADA